jgi:hypothetical protein
MAFFAQKMPKVSQVSQKCHKCHKSVTNVTKVSPKVSQVSQKCHKCHKSVTISSMKLTFCKVCFSFRMKFKFSSVDLLSRTGISIFVWILLLKFCLHLWEKQEKLLQSRTLGWQSLICTTECFMRGQQD